MSIKILVNAVDPGECRVATVKKNKLEEFRIESSLKEITHGNIYKGVISRIEPSLQAVFVDYGAERHGFLQKYEIHSDYFLDTGQGQHSIDKLVKRGQELMVQVTKDPFMKKGAMLTTYISLPGRYLVLRPGSDNRGVSRKIESEEERQRLKDIINKLKIPEDFGLIVRTAAEKASKTAISKDITYLFRLWKTIKDSVMKNKSPALLYKERHLVIRSIRDSFSPEVAEILIDDGTVYNEVRNFIKLFARQQEKVVRQYKGAKPIFSKFQLEDQIASIFESRVGVCAGRPDGGRRSCRSARAPGRCGASASAARALRRVETDRVPPPRCGPVCRRVLRAAAGSCRRSPGSDLRALDRG